jgi:hypothetical protein
MATAVQHTNGHTEGGNDNSSVDKKRRPESLAIAKGGIRTANDFTRLMGALMGDLIDGTISADVGNATCKAGANLLKAIEMQHKYGSSQPDPERKTLALS